VIKLLLKSIKVLKHLICVQQKMFFATGGMDRVMPLWNPYLSARPVAR